MANHSKPCRLSLAGTRYQINSDGTVDRIALTADDGKPIQLVPVEEFTALKVKAEAKRLRRNRNNRERYDEMRSLGMVKTPYGWE